MNVCFITQAKMRRTPAHTLPYLTLPCDSKRINDKQVQQLRSCQKFSLFIEMYHIDIWGAGNVFLVK